MALHMVNDENPLFKKAGKINEKSCVFRMVLKPVELKIVEELKIYTNKNLDKSLPDEVFFRRRIVVDTIDYWDIYTLVEIKSTVQRLTKFVSEYNIQRLKIQK
jgi:hypothetical protein